MSHKTKRFSLRVGTPSILSPAMPYIGNLTHSGRLSLFAQPIQLVRRSLLYLIGHQISMLHLKRFNFQYACQFLVNMFKLFPTQLWLGTKRALSESWTSTNCVKTNGFLTKMKSLSITAHKLITFHNVFRK